MEISDGIKASDCKSCSGRAKLSMFDVSLILRNRGDDEIFN